MSLHTLRLLCELVYLRLQVMYTRGVQPGATHRPTSADLTGIPLDLPRLSRSKLACQRASFSHPVSLNSYFTLICVFFTKAKILY